MSETRTTEPMPIELIETSNTATADAAVSPVPPMIWARYQRFLRDRAAQPVRAEQQPVDVWAEIESNLAEAKRAVDSWAKRLDERLAREQQQQELREMFERIEVDLGLRRDPNWQPEPKGPDALEVFIWGDDAYLTPEQRHIKSLVGFVPPEPERKPYRELSALEMDERAKLKPWRPKRSN